MTLKPLPEEPSYEQILDDLKRVLGFRLPMYVAQADAGDVWGNESRARVRELHRVVSVLSATLWPDSEGTTLSDEGVRSWLLSVSPDFGSRSALDLLRDGDHETVLAAAQNYSATGGVW